MDSIVRDIQTWPQGPCLNERVFTEISGKFPLWFNSDLGTPVIHNELKPYTVGLHYISTKQAPSALLLRFPGSSSVKKNKEDLLQQGFTLEERDGQARRNLTVKRATQGSSVFSSRLSELLIEADETSDILNKDCHDEYDDFDTSGSESPTAATDLREVPGSKIRFRRNAAYRVKYEDPWKIHAGYALSSVRGESPPKLIQWSGDGIRLQDPLPPRLFGKDWSGSQKNRVRFHEIADDNIKLYIIYNHTHWGKALRNVKVNPESPYRSWARHLVSRINRFLKGGNDPTWSKEQVESLLLKPTEKRNRRARALRLIELLKTVDGIFIQRYLAYPEEVWTWERFDMFTLGNISALLGDEFLDGPLSTKAMDIKTAYSTLKSSRKWFKYHSHKGDLERALAEDLNEIPHWWRQFVPSWRRTLTAKGERNAMLIGLLSQTRGAGTPPPLVVLQSKSKFLRTVSTEPPEDNPTLRTIRRRAIKEIISNLPDASFTGLSTKSRVTVTTSACWEKSRREGGTAEEVRSMITSFGPLDQVPIRNLETGEVTDWARLQDCDSIGEFIFWVSLDRVLRTPKEDLKQAFLTLVKEPGKARSVTKARTCLKIVLDLVNKICAEPLKKGIQSSKSGMGMSNHGWNFFLRMDTSELEDLVFHVNHREESAYEGYIERIDTFTDLFVSSTDYEEATDNMLHYVARDLGTAWMLKCGIPAVLRGIVQETCYNPRKVYFYAEGALSELGEPSPQYGENIRGITLRRGILMGDPLTKIVLHLTNVCARHIGKRLYEVDFYRGLRNSQESHAAFTRATGVREP
jgi:hypothetical protein